MTDEKLVMVDKDKLRGLRDNLREAIEAARRADSLPTAWFLLGSISAVLDGLLTEIINGAGE